MTRNLAVRLENESHKDNFLSAFSDLYRKESMVDVTLTCDGGSIKAHRLVLSAGSVSYP